MDNYDDEGPGCLGSRVVWGLCAASWAFVIFVIWVLS
jgi:hypothetical protein